MYNKNKYSKEMYKELNKLYANIKITHKKETNNKIPAVATTKTSKN